MKTTQSNDSRLTRTRGSRRQRVAAWLNNRGTVLHFVVWTVSGVVYSAYLAGLLARRTFWRLAGPAPVPPA